MDALCIKAGIHCMLAPPIAAAGNGELRLGRRNSRWGFSLRHSLRPLWPGGKNRKTPAIAADNAVAVEEKEEGIGDWVLKILRVKSIWKAEEENDSGEETGVELDDDDGIADCEACEFDDSNSDGNAKIEFDQESFSKLLRKVPLEETRFYGRMAYLGNLAYSIPKIEPENLLRHYGLRFVTSSMEIKEEPDRVEEMEPNGCGSSRISSTTASTAYQIAASAASYLHSHTKSILRLRSPTSIQGEEIDADRDDEDVAASLMATADSVTAVVAAKEEIKQAVADDLNSTLSPPCEWFVCDDDRTATRYFIIQGSESLASWQANLLFEPIHFEGMDVLVHRGIYEAAKGIYDQMLPEIRAHLKSHGDRRATFYFTGHSLGGSLSLLVNLMLLIRKEVPYSSLRPVIIFGAPSIMCGGDRLLRKLGLPRSHVQSIVMHRDIVPRAFSCNYPIRVAELLKAINKNFRSLPCLHKKKLLYTQMGEFFILQPDENFSPSHHLLPPGSSLYHLTCDESGMAVAGKHIIEAAQAAFLNTPHPLEILSDRSAYGFGGTIVRDHDMNSYVKCISHIIRQELMSEMRRKTGREQQRREAWWEMMAPGEIDGGAVFNNPTVISRGVLNFYRVVRTGKESLKRLGRMVASHHVHLLVMLCFPTRLIILGTCRFVNYH